MVLEDPKKVLNDEYPIEIRSLFVSEIQRAYLMADLLQREVEWMNWLVGRDQLGNLRNVAAQYRMKKLFDDKKIPDGYRCRINPNMARNCYHVEIIGLKSVMTISQTTGPMHLPRKADFRMNHGIGNQTTLGLFDEEPRTTDDLCYFLLTHGSQAAEPEFVVLGLPDPDLRLWIPHGWVNLMTEPHQVALPPIEVIEESVIGEDIVELKQHLLGVQKDDNSQT